MPRKRKGVHRTIKLNLEADEIAQKLADKKELSSVIESLLIERYGKKKSVMLEQLKLMNAQIDAIVEQRNALEIEISQMNETPSHENIVESLIEEYHNLRRKQEHIIGRHRSNPYSHVAQAEKDDIRKQIIAQLLTIEANGFMLVGDQFEPKVV
jgi:hypothetical protein